MLRGARRSLVASGAAMAAAVSPPSMSLFTAFGHCRHRSSGGVNTSSGKSSSSTNTAAAAAPPAVGSGHKPPGLAKDKATITVDVTSKAPPTPSGSNNSMTSSIGGDGTGARSQAEMIKAATSQLKVALDEWSKVERLKAERKAAAAAAAGAAGTSPASSTTASDSPPPSSSSVAASASSHEKTAKAAAGGSDAGARAADVAAAAATENTSPWVRNKRPRFWALVQDRETGSGSSSTASTSTTTPTTTSGGGSAVSPSATAATKPPLPPAKTSSETAKTTAAAAAAPVQVPPPRAVVVSYNTDGSEHLHHTYFSPRSEHKRRVAQLLVEVLDRDPALGPAIVGSLSAENRRLMLVMGTANEYFSEDYGVMADEIHRADSDRDNFISSSELDEWTRTSFLKHRGAAAAAAAGISGDVGSSSSSAAASDGTAGGAASVTASATAAAGANANAATTSANSAATDSSSPSSSSSIPWPLLARLFLAAAMPFFAFGMLDNTTFIFAGDAIDRTLGESFGLSEMAAAGLGGVCSGVAGIQVHGLAERCTRAAPPALTPAQMRSAAHGAAVRWGNTVGMVLGLCAGMLPLLVVGVSADVEEDVAEDVALFQSQGFRREAKLLAGRQAEEERAIAKEEAAERAALVREHKKELSKLQ